MNLKNTPLFIIFFFYSSQLLGSFLESSGAYSIVNPLTLFVHQEKENPRPFLLEIFEVTQKDNKNAPSSQLICSISYQRSKPNFKENCSHLDLIFQRPYESNSYAFGLLVIFLDDFDLKTRKGSFSKGSKKYKIKIKGGDIYVKDKFKKMKSKKINLKESHLELFSNVVNLLDIGLSGVLQAKEKYNVDVVFAVGRPSTGFPCKLNENQIKALFLDNKEIMKNIKRIQKVISSFQLIGRMNEGDEFDSHDPVHYVFDNNPLFERLFVGHSFRSGHIERLVGITLRLKEGKDCREDLDIYK